jgi:hypothetical protein
MSDPRPANFSSVSADQRGVSSKPHYSALAKSAPVASSPAPVRAARTGITRRRRPRRGVLRKPIIYGCSHLRRTRSDRLARDRLQGEEMHRSRARGPQDLVDTRLIISGVSDGGLLPSIVPPRLALNTAGRSASKARLEFLMLDELIETHMAILHSWSGRTNPLGRTIVTVYCETRPR